MIGYHLFAMFLALVTYCILIWLLAYIFGTRKNEMRLLAIVFAIAAYWFFQKYGILVFLTIISIRPGCKRDFNSAEWKGEPQERYCMRHQLPGYFQDSILNIHSEQIIDRLGVTDSRYTLADSSQMWIYPMGCHMEGAWGLKCHYVDLIIKNDLVDSYQIRENLD